MTHRFAITLGNTLADYARLAEAAQNFAQRAGLSASETTHLELVLEELVINVIKHGFADGREGRIDVEVQVDDALAITIADDGDAFDPLAALPPDLELDVQDRPIGGLGIYFVRSFMDEARYERREGRNVLWLKKNRSR